MGLQKCKGRKIQQSVSGIDWSFIFQEKTVNQKVNILNECLVNVFHNFIPKGSNLVKRYYKNGNKKKNTDLEKALAK